MYTSDQTEKRWWQQKLESIRSKPNFNADQKKHILERLTAAEGLERFCTPNMWVKNVSH
jgi:2-oxoglutarate dehydrogenase E1 component